jgi:CHAD domain-containing protein
VTARARSRARAFADAIARAGGVYHPERLHEVRIAGKKLRYALEVVGAMALEPVAADIRLLKRVQERLGLLHDYQVLLEHVAAVADATPAGARGAAGLRTLATAYDRECRRLHAGYLEMVPALSALSEDERLKTDG